MCIVSEDNSRINEEVRQTAFKALVKQIKINKSLLNKHIRKAITQNLEKGDPDIQKYCIEGLKSFEPEQLKQKHMVILTEMAHPNDKELIKCLKLVKKFISIEDNAIPPNTYSIISNLSTSSENEKVKKMCSSIISDALKNPECLPDEILIQYEFEQSISSLTKEENAKTIKSALKQIVKSDIKIVNFSESLSNSIISLLEILDNADFIKYILELIKKIFDLGVSINNDFIAKYVQLHKTYSEFEPYLEVLMLLVVKYDEYKWSDLLQTAIDNQTHENNDIQQVWTRILLTLSQRNISMGEDNIVQIIDIYKEDKSEDVHQMLMNILNNLDTVSEDLADKINTILSEKKQRHQALDLILIYTSLDNTFEEEFVENMIDSLYSLSKKMIEFSNKICKILLNLKIKGYNLPEEIDAVTHISAIIGKLVDKNLSYQIKLEATEDYIANIADSPIIPEDSIFAFEYNISSNMTSKLAKK